MEQFSLCAIYKNEEKNLETFITNHIGLVDEMILVDTGSTDRSNEIVQSHGLRYHFFQWTKNFSEARNFSLTLPTKPWVIVLDIDEQVLKDDFIRLQSIMEVKQKDAYSLKQINFTDSYDDMTWKSVSTLPQAFHTFAKGYIESPLIRVFRNHKGIRFHGAIHELVGEFIHRLNLSSSITDIPIYHYGWITSNRTDEEKQRKKQEYHRLIKHEWEKDPSPKMAFYYLSTMESPEEKIKFGFKMVNEFPEVIQFHELIARSAVELKQWNRALSYVDKGLQRFPGHTPFLAIKAKCLNETGAPLDALNILDALLEKDPLHPLYWFEKFRSLILLKRKDEAEALKQHLPSHFSPDLIRELLNII